jgi:hypothetical protein
MKSGRLEARGLFRRYLLKCGFAAAILTLVSASAGPGRSIAKAESAAFRTTVAYLVQFYPLWFTHFQSLFASHNRLVGPDRISPLYQVVVAINDDTLYASTFLLLEAEPVILTIPATTTTYSILNLDLYGNILDLGIPSATPGTYGLIGPDFRGQLPRGITRVRMPLNTSVLIFRGDKFSPTGQDLRRQAEIFRKSLKLQTLSKYQQDPSGGGARILPELAFSIPVKTIADELIRLRPITFLEQLQTAVVNSDIPPLSPAAQALSDRFDILFAANDIDPGQFRDGARAAHQMILDNYLNNTGRTNWITFTNIGSWGRQVLDRASITEFIQYGNGHKTAAYFHAFRDGQSRALDGTRRRGYILTFRKRQIPETKRFWSLTAYTPNSIELVRNSARKYVVASYTPGLQFNSNGSVSIYMTTEKPVGIPMANWLPVPEGPFNIMLRVYGPKGSVAAKTYVPPAIQRR